MSFMKKNKAGNFARDSGQACVETMIGRQDGYEEVLTKCARALELPSTQHGDKVVALLSSGGAVIQIGPLVIICDVYTVDQTVFVLELATLRRRFVSLGF